MKQPKLDPEHLRRRRAYIAERKRDELAQLCRELHDEQLDLVLELVRKLLSAQALLGDDDA